MSDLHYRYEYNSGNNRPNKLVKIILIYGALAVLVTLLFMGYV